MKKLYFLFLAIFMSSALSAQTTIDSVHYRFVYEAVYTNTMETGNKKDMMNLDVGESCSSFYSSLKRRHNEILDSMNHSGHISLDALGKATKNVIRGRDIHFYKGYPDANSLTYIGGIGDMYMYEEPKATLLWTMEDRDTTILGYHCQAATAHLRGRIWHVWFTEDIPISNGPWKLWGLPGIILKAEETEGYYSFNCIGIENANNEAITINKKNTTRCTPEELQCIDWKYYHDSVHRLGEGFAEKFIRDYGGDGYETPVLIEDYENKKQGK